MDAYLSQQTKARVSGGLLAIILLGSFLLKLHHLGHLALKGLDESFHAIVAMNLLEHPLTPTLIDRAYLPYDYRDWQNNHIWLHKGIVPLWQIALSYLAFGINTFALRLPSALLSTAAVLLTYLIGRELLDRTAALIAAALQALSPAIVNLVHGYVFSDHIDIALLFWVEMGIWLSVRAMRTGSMTDAILAGVAQGLAFLSKMYPALIVSVVAATPLLLPILRLRKPQVTRFAVKHLVGLLFATIVTVAPWLIMCAIRFPDEFKHEYLLGLKHLTHDVEDWKAPWDRLIFGYSLAAYYVFYPSVLVAAIVLLVKAWNEKNTKLWIIHVWAFGVLIPFTLATSKTPSATLIGWPAFFLLYAEMISRAIRGDRWLLGTWLIVTLLAVCFTGPIDPKGMGGEALSILRENLWIVWHVLGALVGGALLSAALIPSPGTPGEGWVRVRLSILILASLASLWPFSLWTYRAWKITNQPVNEPSFIDIARFVDSQLPSETVLLLEEKQKLERNTLMFRSRRTAYAIDESNWRARALTIVEHGGMPVIVSHREWDLPAIFSDARDGRVVYRLMPHDLGLRTTAPTNSVVLPGDSAAREVDSEDPESSAVAENRSSRP